MPEKKDRDAWWSFLSGAPPSVWDPPRQPKAEKKKGRHSSVGSGYGYGQSEYVPYEEVEAVKGVSEVRDEAREVVQMQIGVFMDGVVTGGDVPALPSLTKPPQQNGGHTPECDGTMSNAVNDAATWIPREPTPTLLRRIDHVRFTFILFPSKMYNKDGCISVNLAHFSSPPDVFHTLAQSLSPIADFFITTYTTKRTRSLDIRPSIAR